ncbi:DNA internalization-related competence protein ComEC/Rec2 [Microbulbifer guangxiensis]|uniref:DNA internalization-related competence protein ComEC/Rec2 n=1 Tax=Microbulbifer guangxiensis TaxID=2904249 RepID=UPI001F024A92|nr:DNA internalization-related competence protein ComEC/Rec2 [Microbulbifer guangxiensis]
MVAAVGLMVLALAAMLPWRRVLIPVVLAGILGALLVSFQGHRLLDNRLPESAHGSDLTLPLRIVSLPATRESSGHFGRTSGMDIRFSAEVLPTAAQPQYRGKRIRLTWYRAAPEIVRQLQGGTVWSLPVRLKRPRGSVNPHGFDAEGWMLRQGVYATGYVRPRDAEPRLIGREPGLTAIRQWFREQLVASELNQLDLMLALVLGDRSGLSVEDQRRLRESGTAHLIAISGLHVGMVAGAVALLAGLLARLLGLWFGRSPRILVPGFSLLAAGAYVLLAGAPLSARRALVMLLVFFVAWYWRRRFHSGFAFAVALALVLTLQPFAFYGPGFWLSFLAVAALLVGFRGRYRLSGSTTGAPSGGVPVAAFSRGGQWLRELLRSQWLIGLTLALPSLVFFHGLGLSGFLFNLIAIPWLAIGILPLLLTGTLLVGTGAGWWCLSLASMQLEALMAVLGGAGLAGETWLSGGPPGSPWLLALYAAGLLWLVLPAGIPGRNLGWAVPILLIVDLFVPWVPRDQAPPTLEATVLDVGQGLSVVLRTPAHALVYDAGPGTAEGWNTGSQILAPFLLGEGTRSVDLLVLSHGDSDHAGGFHGLTESMSVTGVKAPGALAEKLGGYSPASGSRCIAGESNRLGDMRISWLWPDRSDLSGEENDHSCVALIEWHGRRVLLAGDISSSVERQLASRYPDLPAVDLLVAPHHGSRSSSSDALLAWSRPAMVVFSAGYRHHFGHPHPEVVERYSRHDTRLFSTAESGAVTIRWDSRTAEEPRVTLARDEGRFWHRP